MKVGSDEESCSQVTSIPSSALPSRKQPSTVSTLEWKTLPPSFYFHRLPHPSPLGYCWQMIHSNFWPEQQLELLVARKGGEARLTCLRPGYLF